MMNRSRYDHRGFSIPFHAYAFERRCICGTKEGSQTARPTSCLEPTGLRDRIDPSVRTGIYMNQNPHLSNRSHSKSFIPGRGAYYSSIVRKIHLQSANVTGAGIGFETDSASPDSKLGTLFLEINESLIDRRRLYGLFQSNTCS